MKNQYYSISRRGWKVMQIKLFLAHWSHWTTSVGPVFGSLVPMNHECRTFEPPVTFLSYLGALQRILPKADISTNTDISRCNAIYNVTNCDERT